jgi:transcriptional regulator with XRE-family HTH domain
VGNRVRARELVDRPPRTAQAGRHVLDEEVRAHAGSRCPSHEEGRSIYASYDRINVVRYSDAVKSADLIREARLRAGLSQQELAARSGRDRAVIARWEQAVVAPSVETLVEIVRACGFDLPLELVPHDASGRERLERNTRLSPERRVQRMLREREKGAGPSGG